MKRLNKRGFSLVELIVVIAIMAVLVGVIAPQFMKYVVQSRRSTDVSTAEAIRQAILADISDEKIGGSGAKVTFIGGDTNEDTVKANPGQYATTVTEKPQIQGNVVSDKQFTVTFDSVAGTCQVYAGDYCLTEEASAESYKKAE